MKIKYNSDILSGAILAAVGIAIWLLIPSQIATLEKSSINAQTIPRIAAGGLTLFSVLLLLQGILFTPKKEVEISKATLQSEQFRKEMRSVLYAGILLIYGVLLTVLGFVIATILLVAAILIFYGARKWYYYTIPVAIVGIVYYVFHELLRVTLP